MQEGIFKSIEGLEDLERSKEILKGFSMKKSGTEISNVKTSGNRVGAIIIKGNDYDDVENKEREVIKKIKVLDIENNDCLIRYFN